MSAGTHKPAEAVHQIDEPQAEALLELAAYRFTVENREARIAELESQVQRAAEIERAAILLRVKNRAAAGALLVKDFQAIVNDRGPAQAAAPAPDERAAFEDWLGIKPCGAAHDFGWAAWRARAALAANLPAAQGMELANCKGGKWLTVVYRDIQPGDEARTIGEHPKVSALSWSHALNDRDAALAAQAKQGGAA